MKNIYAFALSLVLLLALCGCSGKTEKAALEQCDHLMTAVVEGNWDTLQEMLGTNELVGATPDEAYQHGIMSHIMGSVTYEISSVEELESGSLLVTMQIENVDLGALLQSLPNGITSEEDARAAMIARLPEAPRKQFDALLMLIPSEDAESWSIEIDRSFANALTGGMYDLLTELLEGALDP